MKMESVEPIQEGTRVELAVLRQESTLEAWLPGRAERLLDEEILVSLAVDASMLALLHGGTPVRVCYNGKRALYCFDTVVTRHVHEGIVLVGLECPRDINRLQRREFVRLCVSLPVRCRESRQKEEFEARTVDLSGGGMALISSREIPVGCRLDVWIDLGEPGILPMKGEARWLERLDIGEQRRYMVGVTFLETSEKTQDFITGFVFSEQARLRRLGLL